MKNKRIYDKALEVLQTKKVTEFANDTIDIELTNFAVNEITIRMRGAMWMGFIIHDELVQVDNFGSSFREQQLIYGELEKIQ